MGAGHAPARIAERLKTQFDYLRDLNLNAIRLEGPMETDEFFDLADEQGMLVMAGWTCCDYWEKWTNWKPSDIEIATASLRSQIESACAAIRACSRGSTAATSRRLPTSSARFSPCSRISTGRIRFFRPRRKTSRRSPGAPA